ncbi:MAG: inositol monophosphatase [Nitrospirae bacterium]|nr:inositol monophosphatase [Nitrospirota bacterium]
MRKYLDIAKEAAVAAGNLLKDNVHAKRDISYKGEINLVTEMDRLSEKIIVGAILGAFPGHGILAEEGARVESASGFLWVIDPLDGTTNYAHGYPSFSVSIGLERDGETVLGVVYDPMRDELFSAVRGAGALRNGQPIAVSQNDVLIKSLLATGFPYDRTVSRENNLNFFNALIMASQEVRRSGSASLDLCSVAAGRLDGYWELKLQPWDVAAGSLIVREAGGKVSDFTGTRFSIHDKEIIASNDRIHDQMLDVIRAVQGGS